MQEFLGEIPLEATLPWDHVDTTVLKEFLVREWKRAMKAKLSPACEKPFNKFNRPFKRDDKLICYDCGCACDLPHITEERVANHENLLRISSKPGLRTPLAPAPKEAPVLRYRATFSKSGRSRFISHLDLSRGFARAFRRAGVSLKYSQGFNPKPLLAFTPALALGVEGAREAVDFQLGAPASIVDLRDALNAALPGGITVEAISVVPQGAPSLAGDVRSALYSARVPYKLERATMIPGKGSGSVETMPFNEESGLRAEEISAGAEDGESPGAIASGDGAFAGPILTDAAWHRGRVEAFNAAGSLMIEKRRKGAIVQVDLRKFVREVSLDHAGETGGIGLSFSVAFFEGGASVRPEEVLIGIYGFLPRGCDIVREDLRFASALPRPGTEPHAAEATIASV